MHYWFKYTPCKCEDFLKLEQEMNMEINQNLFLCHINSRWLTLLPAIERVLAQLLAAQKYFLDFLPHKKNKRYIRIQNLLIK